mmetsp:Transcript_4895/g.10820  ORF Transcript_4895/g.10820 Transcript_4895/m.10820 type:complete len:310 (-) Transcript_4895:137-1066(-)
MNKFQTVVSLLLAITADAFTLQSVPANLGQSRRKRANNNFNAFANVNELTTTSSRTQTKIFLQKYDADNISTVSRQQTFKNSTLSSSSLQLGSDMSSTVTTSEIAMTNIAADDEDDNAYVRFAKEYPFINNFIIASLKTTAADLLAQLVIAQTPVAELDFQRSLVFCAFGGIYSGAFQYMYQVQIFKKLFDVDKFTSQSWSKKLKDMPGIKALAAQTTLDLTILTLVYLPAFYIFKASVFSGSSDPSAWFSTGVDTYTMNFGKDEADLLKVWLPADLICFSVPLYLRMPVRQSVSFLWTAYLSFARGGH